MAPGKRQPDQVPRPGATGGHRRTAVEQVRLGEVEVGGAVLVLRELELEHLDADANGGSRLKFPSPVAVGHREQQESWREEYLHALGEFGKRDMHPYQSIRVRAVVGRRPRRVEVHVLPEGRVRILLVLLLRLNGLLGRRLTREVAVVKREQVATVVQRAGGLWNEVPEQVALGAQPVRNRRDLPAVPAE